MDRGPPSDRARRGSAVSEDRIAAPPVFVCFSQYVLAGWIIVQKTTCTMLHAASALLSGSTPEICAQRLG
jgi:hypothetical protein